MSVSDDEAARPVRDDHYPLIDTTAVGVEPAVAAPSAPDATGTAEDRARAHHAAGGAAPRPARVRFRDRRRGWLAQSLSGGAQVQIGPPAATIGEAAANSGAERGQGAAVRRRAVRPRRRARGVLAAVLAVILLFVAIARIGGASSSPAATSTVAPTAAPLAATTGSPLIATTVLGAGAGLSAPRSAVQLADGGVVVADTGAKRLLFFDAHGRLTRAVTSGAAPLQEPYAVVATARGVYLLDAGRGAIDRYGNGGRFEGEVYDNPAVLGSARDMALGPDGALYVANPRTNTILALTPGGQILHQFTSALGSAPDQYNQPSAVGVASNGAIYVLDNANGRIKELRPDGSSEARWPAPPSDTLHSVHLLPLSGGRLLASDPAGSLLLYPAAGANPTRLPLQISGRQAGRIEPLGLSKTPHGDVLITDGGGNRLLSVALP